MSNIDAFVSQSGAGTNYNAVGSGGAGSNLGTITPPAGMNAAIGFESAVFSCGYDAVVLDGPRSSYAIQVNASGVTTIKDIGVGDATYGQTVTVSGESFIVFNPAATVSTIAVPQPNSTTSVLDYPNNIYYVLNQAHAQMTQFYAATLPWEPVPNTGGLEYWMGRLDAGMSLTSIAQSFINTPYFQQTFGDPGSTHAQHQTFILALYKNILGWTLDATNGGVQYWTNAMDTNPAMDGAHALISFTNATSTTGLINAEPGATAGAGSGWLINYAATGGYADPGVGLGAQALLTQMTTTNYLDTNFVNLSSIPAGTTITTDNVNLSANSTGTGIGIALWYGATGVTVVDSSKSGVPLVDLGTNTTIISAPNGGSFLQIGYQDAMGKTTNNTVILHGSGNKVIINGLGNTVTGYQLDGTETLYIGNMGGPNPTIVTTATTAHPLSGATIAEGLFNHSLFDETFIYVGNLSDGSAATMAAAANSVYTVAGIGDHTTVPTPHIEYAVFYGSAGNDTVMFAWHPVINSTATSAEVNGNHLVDASEFTSSVTLIGVNATSITAASIADRSFQ